MSQLKANQRQKVLDAIEKHRLISIIRADTRGRVLHVAACLSETGVRLLEVSMISPDFDRALRDLADSFGDSMILGAGTVLTKVDLQRAIDAGASFIVSQDGNPEVIEKTRAAGLVSLPGAMTPTEAVRARACGADFVKLFPAVSLGPEFVRAMRGPLPELKLVPTGGVQLEHLPAYWQAGAAAVAIGSELVSQSSFDGEDLKALSAKARAFVAAAERPKHA
jgi:2-dehydro-3-deoxyphosphogluconate aldolase/(4S)-4-hydroxy-2-oxoglutarate aldolase